MRRFMVIALVLIASAAGSQSVQAGPGPSNSAPLVRTGGFNARGELIPAVTRLHPVIGSAQRTSHFSHPVTGRAKYSSTMYNPVTGTFGTQKFKK